MVAATLTAGQWGLVLLVFAGFVAANLPRRRRSRLRRVVRYRIRHRNFSTEQRQQLLAIYHGRCFYCGVPVHYESTQCQWVDGCDTCFEADHYIPASKGGPTTIANGRASCRYHNRMKGDLMPDEFLAGARR